jgi:hypothetical protein
MSPPRIYADLQTLDDLNRVRLTCAGTLHDLARQGITLREGLVLTLCMDVGQDDGTADGLQLDGFVQYDVVAKSGVAAVDWKTIHDASEQARP